MNMKKFVLDIIDSRYRLSEPQLVHFACAPTMNLPVGVYAASVADAAPYFSKLFEMSCEATWNCLTEFVTAPT